MFSIDEPTHLILKRLDKFTTNIKCEKSRSTSIGKYFFFILDVFFIYMYSSIGDK